MSTAYLTCPLCEATCGLEVTWDEAMTVVHDRLLPILDAHVGVNSNLLADDLLVDELTGTAVLNGIPITVVPA